MSSIDAMEHLRNEKIHSLLLRATRLSAAERDDLLCQEFEEDATLRQQIYAYLMSSFGNTAISTASSKYAPEEQSGDQDSVNHLGRVLGDYHLTGTIGVGGTGVVYLGERADSAYSAQVAVKVLAKAASSEESQRRFVAERQILASLNHPYIARLLDGGETERKEPFLVMEYVEGTAIDQYCDNNRLDLRQRLQLFIKVCQAVQYAHRNLVVHRDLKPGNILISLDGTPKLLDFGIAKLVNNSKAPPQEKTPHTLLHDRRLTPEYASPEQIRGQTVTTATDVYSLGVVLYELLTGVRPYSVNASNQLELERSICVIDPVKPSQMLGRMITKKPLPLVGATPKDGNPNVYTPAPDVNAIAQARVLTPKKLQQRLIGDLDAIIMRALRKESEQRYSSVEQLIEDIQRHLDQEPVSARQGNWSYYSSRFIRRHALAVTLSSVALMALFGFAVAMSIQAKRIAEQRDKATQESARAESVSNFLQDIFTAADPYQSQDRQVTAKELLDKAAERINNDLTQQPEVRARLLEAIGTAYGKQGQVDAAIRYLEDAVRTQRLSSSQDKIRLALALDRLGHAYFEKDNFTLASNALGEARSLLEASGKSKSTEYLQVLIDSGQLEHRLSHVDKAQNYYEMGHKLSRSLYGNYHPETAGMLMQLAEVLAWQSRFSDAEKLSREATDIYRSTLPKKHPDRIASEISLAQSLYRTNKIEEADKIVHSQLVNQQSVFGADNIRLLNTYDVLCQIQIKQRKFKEAETSARTAFEIAKKKLGQLSFDTGVAQSSLADVLLRQKKYLYSEKEALASLRILQATASPDHQYTASAEYLLAASLVGQRKSKEAEPMLRENMARWTRAEAPAWRTARSESLLGVTLMQLRKPKDAAPALMHSYQVLSAKDSGADADTIAVAKKRVDEYQRCVAEHRENNCQLSE